MAESVKHILEKDLITRQAEAEEAMLREFEDGDFTFDKPLVKLNPYLISPCSAVLLFRTKRETAVTVTVRGKTPEGNISHVFPTATIHILPVLGLYPGTVNTVGLRLYQGREKTVTIETLPAEGAAAPVYMHTSAAHLKESLIVLTPAGFSRLTGIDYAGDVRWYISIGLQMGLKRLRNGHLLISTDRMVQPPYYSTGVCELDMTGKIYAEYQIPGGYHHDLFEMPDGDLLLLCNGVGSHEDACVLVDRNTGAVKKTWDFRTILTPGEGASGLATDEDWFHGNALWYDEKTNSLTFSGRHVDALVNVDFNTGSLNWILGDPEGWPEDKKQYFFKPEGEGFSWQYAQHACVLTPGGDVMCFDNGTLRSKNKERYLLNKDNFSRGVRYSIDTEAMTIRQVWEYGRERGAEFFSQHISNVEYYGEGHYLVHSGGIMLVDGVPPEGLVPPGPDSKVESGCVTVELLHDQVVLELKCRSNYFRASKMSLYHEGTNLALTPGKRLGSLAPTQEAENIAVPASSGELLPEVCAAHLIEESDRISLKARFETAQSVFLLLVRGDTVKAYKVTTGDKFASFIGMPHLEPDDRNTSTTVHKAGLSGAYDVRIMIDGTVYETGVTLGC